VPVPVVVPVSALALVPVLALVLVRAAPQLSRRSNRHCHHRS
jgi:hypothetical protein